jgi:hypothetical protein
MTRDHVLLENVRFPGSKIHVSAEIEDKDGRLHCYGEGKEEESRRSPRGFEIGNEMTCMR